MISNFDRYKDDLSRLIEDGRAMSVKLTSSAPSRGNQLKKLPAKPDFNLDYQRWYSEAYAVLKQILPQRLQEFEQLYRGNEKRKQINEETFSIQDWLLGLRSNNLVVQYLFDDQRVITMRLITQVQILESAQARFESSLFDIRQLVQADIFDSELGAARELHRNGFFRAAGAVAGVVLEKHLAQVCDNHNVSLPTKKHYSLADYNNALKGNSVIDAPTQIFIDRLRALRNLCDHKGPEPKKEDVSDLIDGTDKITKTLF